MGSSNRPNSWAGCLAVALLWLMGRTAEAASGPVDGDPAARCEVLAAYPLPEKPGVTWEALDPSQAIPACEAAVAAQPDQPDLKAHLCRALRKDKQFETAVLQCRASAEAGSAAGQVQLAYCYAEGEGVPQDPVQAVAWYRKAAEQGYASAQANLGWMYANGRGIGNSDTEAVAWYRKAAEQGDAQAQGQLGMMYELGRGVAQSDAEAVAWYRMAGEQGRALVQVLLGLKYKIGDGVEQSDTEAVVWFRKAAEQGNDSAQFNLGVMYENGRGVEQSDTEAVAWYRKAAEQGDADAQYRLGLMYDKGRGVEQSDTEAVVWFRKAAEQGDASAQFDLGFRYYKGRGVNQSDTEAVVWYRKAAKQGDASAQVILGWMYENGRGVDQSDTEAVTWYRKAAEQGDAAAQNNLGVMYAKGRGVNQSDTEAVVWFRKAAEQNDPYASASLGEQYEKGRGVEQDPTEALRWFLSAADRTVEEADDSAQQKLRTQLSLTSGAATRAMLAERADAGSIAAAKVLIGSLFTSNEGPQIQEALSRQGKLAAAEGRAQPWLDGALRRRLDTLVLASLLGQLRDEPPGSAAAQIAGWVQADWPLDPDQPEWERQSWADLYAMLRKNQPGGLSRHVIEDWLAQLLILDDGLAAGLGRFSKLVERWADEGLAQGGGPLDWLSAWVEASRQPVAPELGTRLGALLLAGGRREAGSLLESLHQGGSVAGGALLAVGHELGLGIPKDLDRAGVLAQQVLAAGALGEADQLLMARVTLSAARAAIARGETQAALDQARRLETQAKGDLRYFRTAPVCHGPWDVVCVDKPGGHLFLEPSPLVRVAPEARDADCESAPRRLRALLLGVGHYRTKAVASLAGPSNDLRYLQAALGILPFPERHLSTLANQDLSWRALTAALNELRAGAGCGDLLWVHFSGQGEAQAGLLLPAWKPATTPDGPEGTDAREGPPAPKAAALPHPESFTPRDLAALVLAARASGASLVVSLDAANAAAMDPWLWMGSSAIAQETGTLEGADDWWVATGHGEPDADAEWGSALLGKHPGPFLVMAPRDTRERQVNRCKDLASGESHQSQGDCEQPYGLFSYWLATALMTENWSTPAELARALQNLPRAAGLAVPERMTVRFVTSDRSYPLVDRSHTARTKGETLKVEIINPRPSDEGPGFGLSGPRRGGDLRKAEHLLATRDDNTRGRIIRVRENVIKLDARLTEQPLPSFFFVNGQPTPLRSTGQFAVEIPVQAVESSIQVMGIFADDTVRRNRIEVRYEGKIEDLLGHERYYALLIGNQDYENSVWKSLKTPLHDVSQIAEQLTNLYGFRTELVSGNRRLPLILRNAKKLDIERTLAELKKELTPRDRLLIYYAGHGYKKDDRAYWIPVDGSGDPADDYSWINARFVANQLKDIPAKSVLLVVDSCFSGGFARFGEPDADKARDRAGDERTRKRYLEESLRRASRKLLSSGGNEPVWDEGGQGHSIFARAFLTALADMKETAFSAADLFSRHILQPVAGNSQQMPQYESIPDSGHEDGDFVFMRKQDNGNGNSL